MANTNYSDRDETFLRAANLSLSAAGTGYATVKAASVAIDNLDHLPQCHPGPDGLTQAVNFLTSIDAVPAYVGMAALAVTIFTAVKAVGLYGSTLDLAKYKPTGFLPDSNRPRLPQAKTKARTSRQGTHRGAGRRS